MCATLHDRDGRKERVEHFDALINCTGIDDAAGVRDNLPLAALHCDGVIRVDASLATDFPLIPNATRSVLMVACRIHFVSSGRLVLAPMAKSLLLSAPTIADGQSRGSKFWGLKF